MSNCKIIGLNAMIAFDTVSLSLFFSLCSFKFTLLLMKNPSIFIPVLNLAASKSLGFQVNMFGNDFIERKRSQFVFHCCDKCTPELSAGLGFKTKSNQPCWVTLWSEEQSVSSEVLIPHFLCLFFSAQVTYPSDLNAKVWDADIKLKDEIALNLKLE